MTEPGHRFRLFVSAGKDTRPSVRQWPGYLPLARLGRGEPHFVAWDEVASADLFVLILGRDIQAPVGVELLAAQRAGKQVLAYRKDVRRTQAAEAFARHAALDWVEYGAPKRVAHLVQVALVEVIPSHGPARGLPPVERDILRGYLERLCHDERGMPPLEEERRAGRQSRGVVGWAKRGLTRRV